MDSFCAIRHVDVKGLKKPDFSNWVERLNIYIYTLLCFLEDIVLDDGMEDAVNRVSEYEEFMEFNGYDQSPSSNLDVSLPEDLSTVVPPQSQLKTTTDDLATDLPTTRYSVTTDNIIEAQSTKGSFLKKNVMKSK